MIVEMIEADTGTPSGASPVTTGPHLRLLPVLKELPASAFMEAPSDLKFSYHGLQDDEGSKNESNGNSRGLRRSFDRILQLRSMLTESNKGGGKVLLNSCVPRPCEELAGKNNGRVPPSTSSVVVLRMLYLLLRSGISPSESFYRQIFQILWHNKHAAVAEALLMAMENYMSPPPSVTSWPASSPNFGWMAPTKYHYFSALKAHAAAGQSESAIALLKRMGDRVKPDLTHYNAVISACGRAGKPLDATMILWSTIPMNNLEPDSYSYQEAICACAKYESTQGKTKEVTDFDFESGEKDVQVLLNYPELSTAFDLIRETKRVGGVIATQKAYEVVMATLARLEDYPRACELFRMWYSDLFGVQRASGAFLRAFKHCAVLHHGYDLMEGGAWPPAGLVSFLDENLRGDGKGGDAMQKSKKKRRCHFCDNFIRRVLFCDKAAIQFIERVRDHEEQEEQEDEEDEEKYDG